MTALNSDMAHGKRVDFVYSLGYDASRQSLTIRLADWAAELVRNFFGTKVATVLSQNYRSDFLPASQDRWGFGGVVMWVEDNLMQCPLSDFNNATRSQATRLVHISKTLYFVLTRLLDEQPAPSRTEQLLFIENLSSLPCQSAGGEVGCVGSASFGRWIREQSPGIDNEITDAMRHASLYLDPGGWQDTLAFYGPHCEFEAQNFTLKLPGDCVCMRPRELSDVNRGWRAVTHNVDYVLQQMIMLVGLAALETKARRELGL